MKLNPKRTISQNSALHLYFQMVANSLNDSGLDLRKVLKPEVNIPWTTVSVKTFLWKPIQKAMTGKTSTTKLLKGKKEIDLIFDTLNRHLGEKFGIAQDFPSIQTLMKSDVKI